MTSSTPDETTSRSPDEPSDVPSDDSLDDDVIALSGADDADRGRRGRRRGGGRKALIASLVIVLILVGGVYGALRYIQHRIDSQVERIPDVFESVTDRPTHAEPEEGDGTPVNFLVLGSDSRISAGDASEWQAGAQRTDAIMIVHLSGDRRSAVVMSIPRDSWVPIPGYGDNKVNAAFSFGGPSLMVQTVEDLTNIPIDHFAVTDFESFATLTDELGGVEIHLPNGMQGTTRDGRTVDLPPGTHLLDGEEALMYARDRSIPGGDLGRVQRQQNWMRAMMSAVFRENLLRRPTALYDFAQVVAGTVAVDEHLSVSQMTTLGLSMRDVRPDDVTFLTAPVAGTGWSPDGRQSIVELDMAAFDELNAAIAEDRAAEYLDENPDVAERLQEEVR
ncbi:LCP family protein [Georgenia sp. Z1491]|uniref:LCP family protein n=1 Tax=Georgenia sp. Z1491 TaxID=3416707 RepID=UPI003CF465F4